MKFQPFWEGEFGADFCAEFCSGFCAEFCSGFSAAVCATFCSDFCVDGGVLGRKFRQDMAQQRCVRVGHRGNNWNIYKK